MVGDPNAALWASITPPHDPSLSTKVRRRMAAFSPDMLAHRLRLAFPGIFASHATAFYAVLGGAMMLGASVGLIGFAAADALRSESFSAGAERPSTLITSASALPSTAGLSSAALSLAARVEPAARRAIHETPSGQAERAGATDLGESPPAQTLTTTSPSSLDDVDTPAPPVRAKRLHATKKKAKRLHASKKRQPSRRSSASRSRTRNEKARALARALGG